MSAVIGVKKILRKMTFFHTEKQCTASQRKKSRKRHGKSNLMKFMVHKEVDINMDTIYLQNV